MTNNDKQYRQRQANFIRQKTFEILEYRGARADEKTKEKFRRPAYSVGGKKKSERSEELSGDNGGQEGENDNSST